VTRFTRTLVNVIANELSNDVEKYEIEVTKMGQNYSFFLTVYARKTALPS